MLNEIHGRGMAMRNEENAWDGQLELSPERACEILKNVFRACKMEPPSDCEKYFYKKEKPKGST